MAHRIVVEPLSREDGGGFAMTVPELPGRCSDGDTLEEALTNAYDAIPCWMEAADEMGFAAPQPRRAAA